MLNYLWGGMIIVGIIFGVFSGKMPDVTNGALDSAKEAVDLCVMMIGIMSMWVGIMEIATKSGLIDTISRKIRPLIHLLFPGVPKGHLAEKYITTNMIANFLGLGWAATPAGIMAMKHLQEINPNRLRSRQCRTQDVHFLL